MVSSSPGVGKGWSTLLADDAARTCCENSGGGWAALDATDDSRSLRGGAGLARMVGTDGE